MIRKQGTKSQILQSKINVIDRKLQEMRLYKAMIAADGLKPDSDDKARESKLIIQKLRHQRALVNISSPSGS